MTIETDFTQTAKRRDSRVLYILAMVGAYIVASISAAAVVVTLTLVNAVGPPVELSFFLGFVLIGTIVVALTAAIPAGIIFIYWEKKGRPGAFGHMLAGIITALAANIVLYLLTAPPVPGGLGEIAAYSFLGGIVGALVFWRLAPKQRIKKALQTTMLEGQNSI